MDAKFYLTILMVFLIYKHGKAQQEQPIDSITRELQEVIVTARQPATKLIGSTLVSTITGTNLADLGNALDVLAQLPMINVHDNSVSVIGKSNVEIFIDGRPLRDENELQQLLSSDLKKVELHMAPGAAYSSTTDAVLKITTKRKFSKGLSVTDQLNIQSRHKWSVTEYLALAYRTGKWEAFLNGSINRDHSLVKGTTTNSLYYDDKPTVVGGNQHNSYLALTGEIKAGFNFTDRSQSFGAYYRYNPGNGNFNNSGSEWLNNNPVIHREINRRIHAYSHLLSMYYENVFSDKYQLHFDGDFRKSHSRSNTTTAYSDSDNEEVSSNDKRISTLIAGKLYLNFPLCKGDFSIGTQESYTHTTLDFLMKNPQVGTYIPSSLTEATQTSASVFASWSRLLGKFSLSAGLRYEYVDYVFKVNGVRDHDVSRSDNLLTPDLSISYTLNEESQVNLSYKMATVKPPYAQLTGSLSYVGLHEIEGGNPRLRDEHMHDVQFFGMWKRFMIQADFMRSIDTYGYVKEIYPAHDLQLLMHPVNIDVSALSLYLMWSCPVKSWTPTLTAGMYRQWLTLDNERYNKPIFSYEFKNTFALPYGWMLTANISGSSQGDMHTNRFASTWFTMNASIGKTFMKKSLTLKFAATDLFNSANNDWSMKTYGILVKKHQSYDNRGVSLNIIYNFQPYKSKYKGTPASESEMNRL